MPEPTTPAIDQELPLASAFAPATEAQWQSMVNAVLRRSGAVGDDAPRDAGERVLTSHLDDDVDVLPLYTAQTNPTPDRGLPGMAPFVRGRQVLGNKLGGWEIRQRFEDPDKTTTHKAILADLEGGVSSLWLVVGDETIKSRDLADVLSDVYLDLVSVVLDAGADTETATEAYLALVDDRDIERATLNGSFGADPLGVQARTGEQQDVTAAASLAGRLAPSTPGMRTFTVDALAYHEAGASEAEELGCALAAGVAYLRAMEAAGLDLETAASQLEFRYAATADQFLTIAKLRAARRLWSTVTEKSGLAPEQRGQRQHASTSWTMTTRRDPWVNMLRTTTACFAAGAGGADAVTVLPFDAAVGLPDPFARRVARNTQAILIEESHTARVVDPAGGSWYVESLTDDLARAAWSWFQQIESAGGLEAALTSGLVAQRIGATREQHFDRLAHRTDALTGVSEFPLLSETALTRKPYPVARAVAAGALPRIRLADAYEALRDRADTYEAKHGAHPDVAVLNAGASRTHGAVADFVVAAVAPGGFTATRTDDAASLDGRVTVVCATPDDDAAELAATVDGARAAGAAFVLVSGRINKDVVTDAPRLARGVDLIALLDEALERVGAT